MFSRFSDASSSIDLRLTRQAFDEPNYDHC
jgi:hypothetical protein